MFPPGFMKPTAVLSNCCSCCIKRQCNTLRGKLHLHTLTHTLTSVTLTDRGERMPPLSPREHEQFLFSGTPIGIQTCDLLAIMQTRFCCTTQEPCFFPLLSVKKTTYYIIHNLLDKNIIKAVRDYLQQHKQV